MMIKAMRTFLMMLAGICILACTIIPHHHHKNIPCIATVSLTECTHHSEHTHSDFKCEHNHDNSGRPEECHIREYVASNRSSFSDSQLIPDPTEGAEILVFDCLTPDINRILIDQEQSDFDNTPYKTDYISCILFSVISFRAPPFC